MTKQITIPEKYKPPDFNKPFYEKQWGKFKCAWKWHDTSGNWLFCTARYESENNKNIIPFYYSKNEWIPKQPLTENRPLMNIHNIVKSDKNILLVEGEKCYDIGNKYLSDFFDVTTWCAGTGGINKTDFSPIADRLVYYWYDYDDPGYNTIPHMKNVLNKLILVCPPIDTPANWDIGDAFLKDNWTIDDALVFIKSFNVMEEKETGVIKQGFVEDIEFPFSFLGYDKTYHYFLQRKTGQIYSIKKGKLNQLDLYELAPLEFWEDNFSDTSKKIPMIQWQWATNHIIQQSNSMKPFSPDNVRGRGAWLEDGKLLIHTGEHILYQGEKIHVRDYQNNGHIYERLPERKINIDCESLSEEDRLRVWQCLKKLSIQNEIELYYLIGWCILAPFGGSLNWKSNIWATGPSGSGKSHVVEQIVLCFLGDFRIFTRGESTAAGMRQFSPTDSIPLIHDEAEPDEEGLQRIKHILSLARSIETEKKAVVLKGTSNQTGMNFINNKMFMLASVHELLIKESDRSRFSVIRMTKNLLYKWQDFKLEIQNCFTEKIGAQIRKRTYDNFERLRENIESFKFAAGVLLKKQRDGDQIGTLLAGAMFFLDGLDYDYDSALEVCKKLLKDFDSYQENDISDEIKCLMKIFTSKVRWINDTDKQEDTTLMGLVHMAFGEGENYNGVENKRAEKELCKYGIRCDIKKQYVCIAANYEWIKNILKNTEWEHNYSVVIRGLEFVENGTKTTCFGDYGTRRAIMIKAEYVLRLSDDSIFMEAGF